MKNLLGVLVPLFCPGCGAHDVVVCAECAGEFSQVRRVEGGAGHLDRMTGLGPLPVWAVAQYGRQARSMILAWKHGGRQDVTPVLTGAIALAAAEFGREVLADGSLDDLPGTPIRVVPAPTRAAARRRRAGENPAETLARAAARALQDLGLSAQVAPVLQVSSGGGAQKDLGRLSRAANLRGRIAVRASALRGDGARQLRDAPTLLVDDVLTTGATLAAAEGAADQAGLVVLGAVVLAATAAPDGITSPTANTIRNS